ncbi:hypothetical protein [Streptomyces tagetis]|uniref:Uncharacterized protein n=1 Tax=Streptomyces tagetis TaxID=2820809 RepID=A0A940XC98_9ACTN|nr:hypothetical protein [Streptomyces sp. RG38]MBQ0827673.1 hypothetical protein [Streptomyces sp. RG38]
MTTVLVGLLALATGWCWGHRTARIRHIPIGALAAEDQAAILTADRQRFEQLVAGLDLNPDNPGSTP